MCEATGGYERLLVSRLRKAEIAIHVAHPTRVRAFAKACGYEAKTDPRDAQVLSRYGQVFPDARTPQRELAPEREAIRDLLSQRTAPLLSHLRQRGKPGNVAVVAVMRKLLLQLNAVARRAASAGNGSSG